MENFTLNPFPNNVDQHIRMDEHYDDRNNVDVPPKYPNIFATGNAGVGKTTASNYLINTYQYKRESFAGALKQCVKVMFDFSDNQVYGDATVKETIDPRWNISPRQALQLVGDFFRDIKTYCPQLDLSVPGVQTNNNIHVKLLHLRLMKLYQDSQTKKFDQKMVPKVNTPQRHVHSLVIDDIRYPDEVDYIKTIPGTFVRIVRPLAKEKVHTLAKKPRTFWSILKYIVGKSYIMVANILNSLPIAASAFSVGTMYALINPFFGMELFQTILACNLIRVCNIEVCKNIKGADTEFSRSKNSKYGSKSIKQHSSELYCKKFKVDRVICNTNLTSFYQEFDKLIFV